MKNYSLVLLATTIININMFAQTKGDSLKIKKNEIGVNLLPIAGFMGNSSNDKIPAFHVFYKRQIKNNWYGRVGLAILKNDKTNFIQNSNKTTIIALPNSKLSVDYYKIKSNPYLQYNLGIEKRWGKGHVKQFAGFDIGYKYYKTDTKKMYGIRDSITNEEFYSNNDNNKYSDSTILHQKTISNAFLLTPFYGIQLQMNKHFFFTIQAGFDLQVGINNSKSITDNQINKSYSGKVTNFDANMSGISSNFSICYRF